ncbi:predicted protein [Sclerotinia sclerotiorum 1980 UF-70]|uniref:Uncharacterized protein n=1 Tax=Sclerotinia sclerotiorum (strain ATCC 18683 / 1980 / Ss-1) TaxID=665079 RepID=A7EU89_SCLS1|nr:predicted protein [Sclerotinia sclerotiorum 1980 UF-70]EDN93031.1 predicted protein [Sclerotinia sclerotiorum 1980 UF-70]
MVLLREIIFKDGWPLDQSIPLSAESLDPYNSPAIAFSHYQFHAPMDAGHRLRRPCKYGTSILSTGPFLLGLLTNIQLVPRKQIGAILLSPPDRSSFQATCKKCFSGTTTKFAERSFS